MKRKTFEANLKNLNKMLAWLGVDKKMRLACEEAIVNIIEHSYLGKGGKIELEVAKEDGEVMVKIIDQGPPFNPLTHTGKKKEIGGAGLLLMKGYVEKILYERVKGKNILTFIDFSQ